MPFAPSNGIELCYETFGDPADPALLLVMGFTAQMTVWDEGFCQRLADRGRFVIRFDNRDVGLSTSSTASCVDVVALHGRMRARRAPVPPVPYTLSTSPTTRSVCSTTWASSAPTSSVRRWAA